VDARITRILKLLKLISKSDESNIVSAEKLFVANRVLTIAYQQVDDGSLQVNNLTSYVQALIEFRDDKLDFKFEIDKQTGKEQVYFRRLGQSLSDYYSNMFRPSFHNNPEMRDNYAEEEEDNNPERS